MRTSESIMSIAKALASAQAEIETAKETSENPHFRSGYADLAEVWRVVRLPLTKNGLSVWQSVGGERDSLKLTTRLFHTSGEWIEDSMPLILSKQDMQGLGSAVTYAKRYALMGAMGVATEDDDGNDAVQRPQVKAKQAEDLIDKSIAGIGPSEEAIEKLTKTASQHLWKNSDVIDFIRLKWNKSSPRTLNTSQFSVLMETIVKYSAAQAIEGERKTASK